MVVNKVLANKECIHSTQGAANEQIALSAAKNFESRQTRAKVIRAIPEGVRIVLYYPFNSRWEFLIVLHDDCSGTISLDLLPNPIVISVNVDGQQVELYPHIGSGQEIFNVLRRDNRIEDDQPDLTGSFCTT